MFWMWFEKLLARFDPIFSSQISCSHLKTLSVCKINLSWSIPIAKIVLFCFYYILSDFFGLHTERSGRISNRLPQVSMTSATRLACFHDVSVTAYTEGEAGIFVDTANRPLLWASPSTPKILLPLPLSAAKESCPQWLRAKSRWQEKKDLCLEVITSTVVPDLDLKISTSLPPPPTRPHRRQSCPGWAETTVGLSNSLPCALDIEYVHSTLSFFW